MLARLVNTKNIIGAGFRSPSFSSPRYCKVNSTGLGRKGRLNFQSIQRYSEDVQNNFAVHRRRSQLWSPIFGEYSGLKAKAKHLFRMLWSSPFHRRYKVHISSQTDDEVFDPSARPGTKPIPGCSGSRDRATPEVRAGRIFGKKQISRIPKMAASGSRSGVGCQDEPPGRCDTAGRAGEEVKRARPRNLSGG